MGCPAFGGAAEVHQTRGRDAVSHVPPPVREQPVPHNQEAKALWSLRRDPRSSQGAGALSGS